MAAATGRRDFYLSGQVAAQIILILSMYIVYLNKYKK